MIPEIDFGNGLFNYYSIWISDRYPLLRPIVNFFPKGDKKKGIEELTNASGNSFYTRTEAQFFLMRIYLGERNLINALQLSKYLNETYPDNSIFHKYYTQILYQNGKLKQSYMSANNILKKFNSNSFGYNHDEARISHFFIGEYYYSQLNFDKAIFNYLKATEYASLLGKEKMGYSFYSYYYLGKIFFDRNEFIKSKIYFRKVIQLTKRKDDLNKKARSNIRNMK